MQADWGLLEGGLSELKFVRLFWGEGEYLLCTAIIGSGFLGLLLTIGLANFLNCDSLVPNGLVAKGMFFWCKL